METSDRPDHPILPPIDAVTASDRLADAITPDLLAGLLGDGDDELAAWALAGALEREPREVVYDTLLRDAMALIGSRWRDGSWGIAEEHAASQALMRALDRVAPRRGPLRRLGPVAVVAGVRDERHVLGLTCLAHVLEDAGWSVVNLGGDEPADDLARYVERMRPGLVGLTASDPERAGSLLESIGAVRGLQLDPGPAILVGGRIASFAEEGDLDVDWVGTSLVEAAAVAGALAESLEANGPPPTPDEIF